MNRSLLSLSLVALTGCCHPMVDDLDTGVIGMSDEGSDLGINVGAPSITPTVTDTGDTGDTGTNEPCEVSVAWNVETPIVTPSDIPFPRLNVETACGASRVSIDQLQIYLSAESWLGEIGDSRLGVGTEYEHLGVHYPSGSECQQNRCGLLWEIDPTSFSSAYPTSDYSVSFGFTLAAFAYNEGDSIAALWDDVDDELIFTAVVNYAIDGVDNTATVQATVTITPTE